MDLSIIIPAYNESHRLGGSLSQIQEFLKTFPAQVEVLVVVDGATDNTAEIVKQFPEVKLVSYKKNRGKGYALMQGVEKSQGEYVYFCDADLSTPVSELADFWTLRKEYDVVIGSRGLGKGKEKSSFLRRLLGKLGNRLINLALDLDIYDTQCGFKLFRREAVKEIEKLRTWRWGFDFELLYLIKQAGFTMYELPVSWVAEDKYSTFRFSGYITTFAELISVWWRHVKFSPAFWRGAWRQYDRIFKYLVVGVTTNLVKFILFAFFVGRGIFSDLPWQFWGVTGVIFGFQFAETVAQIISVLFNYFSHKYWTFGAKERNFAEVLRYIALVTFNFAISLLMLTIGIKVFGLSEIAAQIVTILAVISWNFLIMKFLVYRVD
jgi:dolichyl-phosphate beta-glucosyltransferase